MSQAPPAMSQAPVRYQPLVCQATLVAMPWRAKRPCDEPHTPAMSQAPLRLRGLPSVKQETKNNIPKTKLKQDMESTSLTKSRGPDSEEPGIINCKNGWMG